MIRKCYYFRSKVIDGELVIIKGNLLNYFGLNFIFLKEINLVKNLVIKVNWRDFLYFVIFIRKVRDLRIISN